MDKGFLSGSDLYEKPVGPVGLGMLCARCRHCLVFYHVREELLLGENIIVLFLVLIPPAQGCWL